MSNDTPKLLLVDDDEKFRAKVGDALKAKGMDVSHAISGIDALDQVGTRPFSVVLMDINMPGLDGLETLREIKARNIGVEVILFTAHGTIETAIEGMRQGAFDYLLKPNEIDVIEGKIREAHAVKAARDERLRKAQERALLDKLEKSVRF